MVLDIAEGRKPNIRELSIEGPRDYAQFDPWKDVTEEDRQKMMVKIVTPDEPFSLDLYSPSVVCMHLLDPYRIKPYMETIWESYKKGMETETNALGIIGNLAEAKIVFGGRFRELLDNAALIKDLNDLEKLTRDTLETIMTRCEANSINWRDDAVTLGHAVMVFPSLKGVIRARQEVWYGIKTEFDAIIAEKDTETLSGIASGARIAFPERFSELDIDGELWEGLREELFRERLYLEPYINPQDPDMPKYPENFYEILLIETLTLFAQEIKVDEDKVEFVFPKPRVVRSTEALPEIKEK